MHAITRRSLLAACAAAATAGATPIATAQAATAGRVDLTGDGLALTALEYAQLLARLSSDSTEMDDYALGGAVAALEAQFAALLGKEAAVFVPSGTLANHLAVRLLAGQRRRVVVQETSHLYNDCGDCAQQLSGLTLLPLAPGAATFSWEQVEAELARAAGGRVATAVGAIAIESPVRRCDHAMFDFESMQRISREARARGIGLHLDGARLFVQAAYAGRPLADYTSLFDTVYVSLWKCFNAGNGAILAGPRTLLEGLYHTRRMFGGNLHHAWPDALVASHYADGYPERLRAAVAIAERTWQALHADPRFTLERIPNGTSRLRLRVNGTEPDAYRARLAAAGVVVPAAHAGVFTLQVNESVARRPAEALVAAFTGALR